MQVKNTDLPLVTSHVFVYKAAVTDFISFKMGDSRYYARFHILSWILTHFFKKKVTVTGVKRDYYAANLYDGYINICVETLLATDRELLYEVLYLIRETLAQGRFVVDSVFGHANVSKGEGNYIHTGSPLGSPVKEVTDESLPFDWEWIEASNGKLPFEWSCYLPETSTEDMLRCVGVYDDGSIVAVFTLNYSIAMDRKACFDEDAPENSDPHLIYDYLEQLRGDVETLWGKNHQQTGKICESLQGMRPYEIDLFTSGQDTFISANLVRAFKEGEGLCTGIVESLDYYYGLS